MRHIAICAVVAAFLTGSLGAAEPAKDYPEVEKALFKQAQAFVEAFAKGDARSVAAFWTADGDYVLSDGRHLKGRQAIEEAFRQFFAENKGAKLQINIESLRFVKPDLAIEDGTSEVIDPEGGPSSTVRYTMVHVKEDGQWRIASVRSAPYTPPSNREHLQGLAWLVGHWVDEVPRGEVAEATFHWTENENFLVGSIITRNQGIPVSGVSQWIGWDPIAKQVRSWAFSSDGGFSESLWTQDGKQWTIKTTAVLASGKKMTSTNIITRIDDDHLTWQSTDRKLDGEALPDIQPVKMKRNGTSDPSKPD